MALRKADFYKTCNNNSGGSEPFFVNAEQVFQMVHYIPNWVMSWGWREHEGKEMGLGIHVIFKVAVWRMFLRNVISEAGTFWMRKKHKRWKNIQQKKKLFCSHLANNAYRVRMSGERNLPTVRRMRRLLSMTSVGVIRKEFIICMWKFIFYVVSPEISILLFRHLFPIEQLKNMKRTHSCNNKY